MAWELVSLAFGPLALSLDQLQAQNLDSDREKPNPVN